MRDNPYFIKYTVVLLLACFSHITIAQPVTQDNADEIRELRDRLEKLESKFQSKQTVLDIWSDMYIGGELELEYVDAQADKFINAYDGKASDEPHPHFQIDQLYLFPRVIKGDLLFSADIAIRDSGNTLLKEAWVKYSDIDFMMNGWVEVGLNDMFIANFSRITETQTLLETAFYRDDELGVKLGADLPMDFYWITSFSNGFALSDHGVSEDDSYQILHDDRNVDAAASKLTVGLAAGRKNYISEDLFIDVMPFLYRGKLSQDDLDFLETNFWPGVQRTNDSKNRSGINIEAEYLQLRLAAQYIQATDSKLHRKGFFMQPSMKFPSLGNLEVVVRYNKLSLDVDATANSLTWDRRQRVFGLVYPMFKRTKLKLEYIRNEEDLEVGKTRKVDNDEVLVQFQFRW